MAYYACMMDDDVEKIYDDGCFLFCVANSSTDVVSGLTFDIPDKMS